LIHFFYLFFYPIAGLINKNGYKYTDFLKKDLELAHNTIAKEIKLLKAFMSEAVDLGYTNNQAFRHRKFSVSTEETESVYLNRDEIMKLYEFDLSDNLRLEQVRDLLYLVVVWV